MGSKLGFDDQDEIEVRIEMYLIFDLIIILKYWYDQYLYLSDLIQ